MVLSVYVLLYNTVMNSLTLYIKTGCPWCKRVLDFAQKHGIAFAHIKEKYEAGVLDDLLARGGKSQFPYLVDETAGVEMYESADIIDYLKKLYDVDANTPIPPAPNACALERSML
jgi:glutaredoxin